MNFIPILSIIVPNYNNSKYFNDCIESILRQTVTDYEIIIADDKLTDNSRSIIEEYTAEYPKQIRAIFNKRNVGVSANWHNAILQSQGRYITTLDSDDFYYSVKCWNRN